MGKCTYNRKSLEIYDTESSSLEHFLLIRVDKIHMDKISVDKILVDKILVDKY